ncbi:hypothetical protein SCHPADRAFT_948204, partial [Schizopora paradoxa]
MRGKRPFRSVFVDVEAVAEEEDEDDEEDDYDEGENDEDIDIEDQLSASAPAALRIEDDDDAEAEFEAFHQRAISRGHRRLPHSDGSSADRGTGTDLHPCANAVGIPGVEDYHLLCYHVKVGKEIMVVLRLMRKLLDREEIGRPLEGIGSVFSVPKSPGRIYVEARSPKCAEQLLRGIHFIQLHSEFLVPLAERVSLLTPGL